MLYLIGVLAGAITIGVLRAEHAGIGISFLAGATFLAVAAALNWRHNRVTGKSQSETLHSEDWAAIKAQLMKYPGVDDTQAEALVDALADRFAIKSELLRQGYSNTLAEIVLDRQGHIRPPGWSSVFFYPGGRQLRTQYLLLILCGLFLFVLFFLPDH